MSLDLAAISIFRDARELDARRSIQARGDRDALDILDEDHKHEYGLAGANLSKPPLSMPQMALLVVKSSISSRTEGCTHVEAMAPAADAWCCVARSGGRRHLSTILQLLGSRPSCWMRQANTTPLLPPSQTAEPLTPCLS